MRVCIRWEGGPALVQTVDFFTPIVDDPYIYGEIAAANALSDVYAMGGRPLTALAIAAFPKEGLEPGTIRAIFQGGFDKLREAGVALLGGHTVQDPEIKFGYAVTGAIDPDARARPTPARGPATCSSSPSRSAPASSPPRSKFDRVEPALAEPAVAVDAHAESRGRRGAAGARRPAHVHACTDVTGFGLVGPRAARWRAASGVTLDDRRRRDVPLFDGVLAIAGRNRSGGMAIATRSTLARRQGRRRGVGRRPRSALLFDPQTSGGLLVAVERRGRRPGRDAFAVAGARSWRIGRVVATAGDTRRAAWYKLRLVRRLDKV